MPYTIHSPSHMPFAQVKVEERAPDAVAAGLRESAVSLGSEVDFLLASIVGGGGQNPQSPQVGLVDQPFVFIHANCGIWSAERQKEDHRVFGKQHQPHAGHFMLKRTALQKKTIAETWRKRKLAQAAQVLKRRYCLSSLLCLFTLCVWHFLSADPRKAHFCLALEDHLPVPGALWWVPRSHPAIYGPFGLYMRTLFPSTSSWGNLSVSGGGCPGHGAARGLPGGRQPGAEISRDGV